MSIYQAMSTLPGGPGDSHAHCQGLPVGGKPGEGRRVFGPGDSNTHHQDHPEGYSQGQDARAGRMPEGIGTVRQGCPYRSLAPGSRPTTYPTTA